MKRRNRRNIQPLTSESDSQVNEMTMLEIVLLLIGIICIAVSFMFSVKLDGTEKTQSTGTKLSDNQIHYNEEVALSERENDYLNAAITNLLKYHHNKIGRAHV